MIQLFDQEYAMKQTLKAQWIEGWKEGLKEGYLTAHFNLVRDGLLPVNIAAREVGMNEELFLSMMNRPKLEEAEQESGT